MKRDNDESDMHEAAGMSWNGNDKSAAAARRRRRGRGSALNNARI